MIIAKYNTDVTVTFGPVLAADGTMSNGALAYTDAKIFKNGSDGALNASATFTHKYEGVYALLLKAADMSAVGIAEVVLNKNPLSAAPVKIAVLPANVYDSLLGNDLLDVNQAQLLGTAPTEGAAGRLAAALTKFGDVATPVFTAASVNQTADGDLKSVKGTTLPAESGAGRDAAALGKLLDVATPLLTCAAAMRGTDGANTVVPDAAGTALGIIGAAGTNLTALGDTRLVNLDATVASRMASATLPALGADSKALISSDAQDLSATLHVDAKKLNGATPNNAPAVGTLPTLGADNKVLVSTDAQDLSGTLSVNAKKLNAATPTNISVADILAGTVDGVALSVLLTNLLASADGKISKAGDVYTFYKQNGTDVAFTLTIAAAERTRT